MGGGGWDFAKKIYLRRMTLIICMLPSKGGDGQHF